MKKALLDLKMKQVMKAVCDVAGLTKESMQGKSRIRKLTEARCAYLNILMKEGRYTYMNLGESLNRDHATVLHHRTRHTYLYKVCKDYTYLYDNCLNQYRCNCEDFEEVLETATRNKSLREKVADLKEDIKNLKKKHKEEIRNLENDKKDLDYKILKLQKENKMNYYSIR
jgi:hypothetical protein